MIGYQREKIRDMAKPVMLFDYFKRLLLRFEGLVKAYV